MKKLIALFSLLACFSFAAVAQDAPKKDATKTTKTKPAPGKTKKFKKAKVQPAQPAQKSAAKPK